MQDKLKYARCNSQFLPHSWYIISCGSVKVNDSSRKRGYAKEGITLFLFHPIANLNYSDQHNYGDANTQALYIICKPEIYLAHKSCNSATLSQ